MRILIECAALRSASAEDREYVRDLLRTLLARGSGHTYSLANWPESACGDCAAFLSPLPRGAASWSVEPRFARPRGDPAPPWNGGKRTVRYFPLGLPEADRPDVLEGPVVATLPETEGIGEREALSRFPESADLWLHVWTRAAARSLERAGFRRERIACIPPPAGCVCPWEFEDPPPDGGGEPYVALSAYGLRVRELARILRGLAFEWKESSHGVSLAVFGRPSLRLRLWAKAFGRRAIRWIDAPRSRAVPLLASARVFVALSGERRVWFWAGTALSTGVPILAPGVPGFAELLADSALYYAADGRRRIPAGIWRWFLGDVTGRILSRRAIERSRYLSWDNFATRLLDLFEEAAWIEHRPFGSPMGPMSTAANR